MAKTYLIIGASGQVGSGVARLLRESGHAVRGATGKPTQSPDQVQLDLVTGKGRETAFRGVQGAFLMSPVGYIDQYRILSPLIRDAKEAGVEKVVLMTAQGTEADEASPFRRAEAELEKSGLAYNIIRPSWFMQNFSTFWLHDIRAHGAIRLPAGSGKNAFIDSRDIAETAAALLSGDRFPNRAFTLTGPQPLDHGEAARILSAAAGKAIGYQDIPPEEFKQGLLAAGMPGGYADILVHILGYLKEGYLASVSDAVRTILDRPPRSLEEYAKDYKAAWA